MDFAFTDEQKMIRDTTESFLAEVSNSEAIRAAMASDKGYDDALWANVCRDLFWQAIHIPEQYGGMGLGYVELVAMLEQMGRHLFCSPFFSTVCFATNALLLAGTEQQKSEYLPRICSGATATLAYAGKNAASAGGVWGADAIQVTARREGDHFILNGVYRYVTDGASAEILIAAARMPGSAGEEGVSLFVFDSGVAGVERHKLPTLDQTRKLAEIKLNNVILPANALMGVEGNAWTKLAKVIDLATIAAAAEQMGGAQQVLDMAVAYTKERHQFNRSIASFQAIKHKAADMMTRAEVARSAVYYAACVAQEALDELHGKKSEIAFELPEAASIAKAYCSDAYFKNAGDALQMHGGVGFTWEYDVHLYFKRAKSSEHFLGNASYHRDRIANLVLGEISSVAQ
ncbi:MAG TPA: acyl-CoA dehydrogenase family protein [Pseudomonadales bacterium]|nr:acyl-CoA dehydrogenase family protein [Pseudomonadales bacterium]